MKTIFKFYFIRLFTLIFLFPNFFLAQNTNLPEKSKEAVKNFLEKIRLQEKELSDKIEIMKKENENASQQIDPSKYLAKVMNQDPNAIMERQQKIIENQQKETILTQKSLDLDTQFRSISDSLSEKMNSFSKAYTDYVNHCIGIENKSCPGYENKKNQMGDEILMKYFFGKNAKFVLWLNEYLEEIPSRSKEVFIATMSYQEESLGIKFPHVNDLAELMKQKATVDAILNVFGEMDLKLFPGIN